MASKQGKYFEFHKAGRSPLARAVQHFALTRSPSKSASATTRLKDNGLARDGCAVEQSPKRKGMFIDGTPTFVVGDKVNPGWTQYEQLKDLVSEARKDGCKSCAAAGGVKEEKKS